MVCVVLCGGAGSRLWPLSRQMFPKPFFHLPNGPSLIQYSIETASQMPGVREIIVVANVELRAIVIVEVQAANVTTPIRYIFEPIGRNTAAAVCTAALDVSSRYGGEEPVLILAADHLIGNVGALRSAVRRAAELASSENKLVVFGIKPTRPETGFGYIHFQGEHVLEFVEKPSFEVAESYLRDENYLWNSGMFCFMSETMLAEVRKHAADIAAAVEACYIHSSPAKAGSEVSLDYQTFKRVPSNSLDYAVMEKSNNIAVVACDIDWNDIGSWQSLCQLYPTGKDNNRVLGDCEAFYIGSENCTVMASGKVAAVIGMKDTLIVDTGDALLITTYRDSQEVRNVYDTLKKRGHETSVIHLNVKPPWGEFTVLHKGGGYKVKLLRILPGKMLSLQSHRKRNETWTTVRGSGMVTRDDESITVKPGDTVFIPVGVKHRVKCISPEPLEITEVQIGEYLGEDDIVRYSDAYGR